MHRDRKPADVEENDGVADNLKVVFEKELKGWGYNKEDISRKMSGATSDEADKVAN